MKHRFRSVVAVALATAALFVGIALRTGVQQDLAGLVGQVGADLFFAFQQGGAGDGFSEKDMDTVANLPGIASVAGQGRNSTFYVPGQEYTITWLNVSANYPAVLRLPLAEGRSFRSDDESVVILGAEVKDVIYGDQSPIGKDLEGFRIIGVLPPIPAEDVVREYLNRRVLTLSTPDPFSLTSDSGGFERILIRADGSLRKAEQSVREVFPDVQILPVTRYYSLVSSGQVISLNRVLIVSAVGLLLMAGVLITALLSLSTLKRTREIGIRRALGATARDILRLFLHEGVTTSLLGGISGLALGILVLVTIKEKVALSWLHLAVLPFTLLIGLVASFLPSWRAARLSPIEAIGQRSLFVSHRGRSLPLKTIVALSVAVATCGLVILIGIQTTSQRVTDSMWGNIDERTLLVRAPRESILPPPNLVPSDADLLTSTAALELVVPFVSRSIRVGVTASAVGDRFRDLRLLNITAGRDLTDDDLRDGDPVCLLSDSLADKAYEGEAVGQSITVRGASFRVVGRFSDNRTGREFPADIVIPFAYQNILEPWHTRFLVRVRPGEEIPRVCEQIVETFHVRYPDRARVTVTSVNGLQAKLAHFFHSAAVRLGLFAAIAALLAAGEIGTLVRFLLAQRTLEFGVRRAVGARRSHLMHLAACQSAQIVLPGVVLGALIGGLLTPLFLRWLYILERPSVLAGVLPAILMTGFVFLVTALQARRYAYTLPANLLEKRRE
jgi:putative ABC transport system permease protein